MSASEKVIRDAVWGDMTLRSDTEMRVVDTREFQRLRGIRQLGTASLVYPTATHTRFDHSLGTCHLAKRIMEAIERGSALRFAPRDQEAVGLAALLHDVTHIPFGHTFEDERRIFERHDVPERTRAFLARGDLGAALERTGLAAEVASLLAGDGPPERAYLREIVSGTVCADLLDYLARDAYFCGFPQRWDERLLRCFAVSGGRLALQVEKRGIIREDALSEVINLLRLRYSLTERVYFHHAKIATGALVSRTVEIAVDEGLTLEDLASLRDDALLPHLRARFPRNREIARLVERYESRAIYKRCYVLTRSVGEEKQKRLIERYHFDRAARERDEARLERKLRLLAGDAIIYCPSAKMALKEADIPLARASGEPRTLSSLGLPEIEALKQKHKNLWRFYVFLAAEQLERLEDASAACEDVFGEPSQLEALATGQLTFDFG